MRYYLETTIVALVIVLTAMIFAPIAASVVDAEVALHIDNVSHLLVVDANTGQPIEGAILALSADGESVAYEDYSSAEGRFSQKVERGDYELYILAPDGSIAEGALRVGFIGQFTGDSDVTFENGDVVRQGGDIIVRMHAAQVHTCGDCIQPIEPVATPTPYAGPTTTPVIT